MSTFEATAWVESVIEAARKVKIVSLDVIQPSNEFVAQCQKIYEKKKEHASLCTFNMAEWKIDDEGFIYRKEIQLGKLGKYDDAKNKTIGEMMSKFGAAGLYDLVSLAAMDNARRVYCESLFSYCDGIVRSIQNNQKILNSASASRANAVSEFTDAARECNELAFNRLYYFFSSFGNERVEVSLSGSPEHNSPKNANTVRRCLLRSEKRGDECTICLSDDVIHSFTLCENGHGMCDSCTTSWIKTGNNTCPTCKIEFVIPSQDELTAILFDSINMKNVCNEISNMGYTNLFDNLMKKPSASRPNAVRDQETNNHVPLLPTIDQALHINYRLHSSMPLERELAQEETNNEESEREEGSYYEEDSDNGGSYGTESSYDSDFRDNRWLRRNSI